MDFDGLHGRQPKQQPPRKEVVRQPVVSETPLPKKRTPHTKKRLIILIAATLLVLILVALFIISQPRGEQPKFSTVLPAGKSINSLGGWKRNSPPENDPVYAYTDTIKDAKIVVSQQPLPERFKNAPREGLEETAKAFNATEVIDGVGAYIGTSAKGPQFVLFIKNKVLVMIKSDKEIPQDEWRRYIRSLG